MTPYKISDKYLDTANREPIGTVVVVVHVHVAAVEVQVPCVVAVVLGSAPVVAVVALIVQRTIGVVAVTRSPVKQSLY
jgi:hypothetical protein